MAGGSSDGNAARVASGSAPTSVLLGVLISLLVAEKSGFQLEIDTPEMKEAHAEKLGAEAAPGVKPAAKAQS